MNILCNIFRWITQVTTSLSFWRGVGGGAILLLLLASCQQEETQLPAASDKGSIMLSFSELVTYLDVDTRAEQPLENISDYDFTLSGTTAEGVAVVDQPLTLEDHAAIFEAGTYTLSVQGNATLEAASRTGLGTPYFAGTSVDSDGQTISFTIFPGGITPVRALLKPANAKLTIQLATSFTALYKTATLTTGTREVSLLALSDSDPIPTATTEVTAYFPAGTLTYTLSATARAGSHVTDIASASTSLSLAAATNTTLTLTANPVSGEIIPIVSGEHSGEFD